jgi:hypothetical protein
VGGDDLTVINLPDWDLSEWSSSSTLAALAFGLYVYWQGQREARRGQASLISAWFQIKLVGVEGRIPRVAVYVSNRSEQPVYNVTVWSLMVAAEGLNLPVLPPATTHDEETAESMMAEGGEYTARLILVFSDARGRRWQRVNGKLTRRHWWRSGWSRLGVPKAVLKLNPTQEDDAG